MLQAIITPVEFIYFAKKENNRFLVYLKMLNTVKKREIRLETNTAREEEQQIKEE